MEKGKGKLGEDSIVERGGKKQEDNVKPLLPSHLLALKRRSFSIFVSNLPSNISKSELEAMFCRVGRIADSFIPCDRHYGNQRGFAFVRFGNLRDAERAMAIIDGRS